MVDLPMKYGKKSSRSHGYSDFKYNKIRSDYHPHVHDKNYRNNDFIKNRSDFGRKRQGNEIKRVEFSGSGGGCDEALIKIQKMFDEGSKLSWYDSSLALAKDSYHINDNNMDRSSDNSNNLKWEAELYGPKQRKRRQECLNKVDVKRERVPHKYLETGKDLSFAPTKFEVKNLNVKRVGLEDTFENTKINTQNINAYDNSFVPKISFEDTHINCDVKYPENRKCDTSSDAYVVIDYQHEDKKVVNNFISFKDTSINCDVKYPENRKCETFDNAYVVIDYQHEDKKVDNDFIYNAISSTVTSNNKFSEVSCKNDIITDRDKIIKSKPDNEIVALANLIAKPEVRKTCSTNISKARKTKSADRLWKLHKLELPNEVNYSINNVNLSQCHINDPRVMHLRKLLE